MVGIIVLNYKNWEETIQCVHSIIENTNIDYKVYIIDNDSPNQSFTRLTEYYLAEKNVQVLKTKENKGYAAGNNFGISKALNEGCTYIVISNPDVIFSKYSIDRMIALLNSRSDIGIVGPKVQLEDNSIQKLTKKTISFKRYISIKKPFMYFMKSTSYDYLNLSYDYDNNYVFEGMVSGCCFVIDKKTIEEIDGFDENTFLYYEEDIIGWKLKKLNKKTAICADAIVIHKGSTTIGNKTSPFSDYHRYVSSYYVLSKYVKINTTQRLIVSIINLGSYTMKAIVNPEYRKKLPNIIKEYRRLTYELD